MVMTGMPGLAARHAVLLNGVEYAIRGTVREKTRETTQEKIYRLSPWSGGVGARSADPAGWPRPNMIYDATADTSKSGGITPPLLIQTATQAGTPTQTQRIFAFGEIGGVLNAFSFGTVAGPSNRLLRWQWDGATKTWTRNDVTAAAINAVGMNVATINGNMTVGSEVAAAGARPSHSYSTNGTSWTTYTSTDVTQNSLNTEWLSNMGTSATGYALLSNRGLYSFTVGGDPVSVLASVYPSTETVKAFFSWLNNASPPVSVLYILTDKAMRQSNATPNAFSLWENFSGGNSAFPYGDKLYVGHNDKGGITEYTRQSDGGLLGIEGGLDLGDGLPSGIVGPVVALHFRNGFLYARVGGATTTIYKRRVPFTPADGWHAVYKAAAADAVAAPLYVSDANDATVRVHIPQTATATTDALKFVMEGGTQEFENGGYVTWPEIVFGDTRGACAVTEASIEADGLTATETITFAFDKDGAGSFTNFGVFTSSVKTLPALPDGGVTMNRGTPRITFARDITTTLKATLRSLVFKVLVKTGLLLEYSFAVDLSASRWTARLMTVNDVRAQIRNLYAVSGLQTFQKDKVTDSTARRVYMTGYSTDADVVARFLKDSGKRLDASRFAIVTVAEAIGS